MNLKEILTSVKDTDDLLIGSGVIENCASLFRKHWPGKNGLIVADSNTWAAGGERLGTLLDGEGIFLLPPLIFGVPPLLHADYTGVELIINQVVNPRDTILIAVGSGTINDLVKRASFELNQEYLCFGTAASMDGYCSSGAALARDGLKQTLACPAPKVIVADTDILKTAPGASSAAGYGDLASKLTAGADWIIADFTGDDPIDESVWNIVQPRLGVWLAEPAKLRAGNPDVLAAVFEGLNFSGLAMQVLGRSRAASGAEHLFSHIWEMSGHLGADGNPVSHGFQVSLGILCVTALMEEVFRLKAHEIDIEQALRQYPSWDSRVLEIESFMGCFPSYTEYFDICREKYLSRDELQIKLSRLKEGWEELKSNVWKKLPHYSEMKSMLELAGCPVSPGDINLDRATALSTYRKAQCMRNRYTILDLAYELGILDRCVGRIDRNQLYLN
ncbi:MAG: sn-glycerol-1-phosphate dehydrogenase [Spirochaetales bacterium]|nr:sn-glycerol-1-phosphate dehydrogenase [Spirochaetales bacterium]